MGWRWGWGWRGGGWRGGWGPWPGRGPFSHLPPWLRPGWLFGRGACWWLFGMPWLIRWYYPFYLVPPYAYYYMYYYPYFLMPYMYYPYPPGW
ncbi:hypothetical protein B6U99_03880 [Candidatus Geothermarchaeota archaeon ex4572_27]|nr:MAG: hypothetical protein B6U99_03880 [Candidatus Geothermarchaeota archaeon ex4572_27]